MQDVTQLSKVPDNQPQVFGIAVAEEQGETGILSPDVEGRNDLLSGGRQPKEVWIFAIRSLRSFNSV